jgi:hypothetical protein
MLDFHHRNQHLVRDVPEYSSESFFTAAFSRHNWMIVEYDGSELEEIGNVLHEAVVISDTEVVAVPKRITLSSVLSVKTPFDENLNLSNMQVFKLSAAGSLWRPSRSVVDIRISSGEKLSIRGFIDKKRKVGEVEYVEGYSRVSYNITSRQFTSCEAALLLMWLGRNRGTPLKEIFFDLNSGFVRIDRSKVNGGKLSTISVMRSYSCLKENVEYMKTHLKWLAQRILHLLQTREFVSEVFKERDRVLSYGQEGFRNITFDYLDSRYTEGTRSGNENRETDKTFKFHVINIE